MIDAMQTPMRLLTLPEPFDHDDFLFEIKWDGFRALAMVDGGQCQLISRNGNPFKQWDTLKRDIAATLRGRSAILDGELVCLAPDGRARFHRLMFRCEAPFYMAFDLLELDGEDLREFPQLERKRQLRRLIPRESSRLRYVDHITGRGCALFAAACRRDLEGVVAKWAHGSYQRGLATSWLKIRNPQYSQMEGRRELFEARRPAKVTRIRGAVTVLRLA